jgi:hypothetical protein
MDDALGYDVTEVTREFMRGSFTERAELIRLFQSEVNHNEMVKRLLGEIAHLGLEQGNGPVGILKLGFLYGAAIGVLLEKERLQRIKTSN